MKILFSNRLALLRYAQAQDSQGNFQEADKAEQAAASIPENPRRKHRRWDEMSPEEKDEAYQTFSQSYENATGEAWDRNTFESRAKDWEIYGNPSAFITARAQRADPIVKLTGIASAPGGNQIAQMRQLRRNLQDLVETDRPVWGAVSEDIRDMAVKSGHFLSPSPLEARFISMAIPKKALGTNSDEITPRGGLMMKHPALQHEMEKFLIATPSYYEYMIHKMETDPEWQQRFGSALPAATTALKGLLTRKKAQMARQTMPEDTEADVTGAETQDALPQKSRMIDRIKSFLRR